MFTELLTSMLHEPGFVPFATTADHSGFQAVVKFEEEIPVSRPDNFHSSSGLDENCSVETSRYKPNSGVFHDGDRPLFDIRVDIRKIVLSPEASEERHLAVKIANCIREVADEFGVRSKVVCVDDNTANVMRAGSILNEEDGWRNIGRATRLLQRAVNIAPEDVLSIQKALASARRSVGPFKKSTVFSSSLHQRQRAAGHPELQLISDCARRCNYLRDGAAVTKRAGVPRAGLDSCETRRSETSRRTVGGIYLRNCANDCLCCKLQQRH